jgi:hypothetical protein
MEVRAANAHYAVVNGVDAGRVGLLVDVLEMEELFGGWRDWLMEKLRIRPRRRWQATWIVLEFEGGEQGAYRLSELEPRHG